MSEPLMAKLIKQIRKSMTVGLMPSSFTGKVPYNDVQVTEQTCLQGLHSSCLPQHAKALHLKFKL